MNNLFGCHSCVELCCETFIVLVTLPSVYVSRENCFSPYLWPLGLVITPRPLFNMAQLAQTVEIHQILETHIRVWMGSVLECGACTRLKLDLWLTHAPRTLVSSHTHPKLYKYSSPQGLGFWTGIFLDLGLVVWFQSACPFHSPDEDLDWTLSPCWGPLHSLSNKPFAF